MSPAAGASPVVGANKVIALWAHSRSASTAFVRMMLERGDVEVLHEPFLALTQGEPVTGAGAGRRQRDGRVRAGAARRAGRARPGPPGVRQGGARLPVRLPVRPSGRAGLDDAHLPGPRPAAGDQLALRGEAHRDLPRDRLPVAARAVPADLVRHRQPAAGAAGRGPAARSGRADPRLVRGGAAAVPAGGSELVARRPAGVAAAPGLAPGRDRQLRLYRRPEQPIRPRSTTTPCSGSSTTSTTPTTGRSSSTVSALGNYRPTGSEYDHQCRLRRRDPGRRRPSHPGSRQAPRSPPRSRPTGSAPRCTTTTPSPTRTSRTGPSPG